MKYVSFTNVSYQTAAELLPREIAALLTKKEVSGGIAVFAGEAAGAVAWDADPDGEAGRLRSIYVKPEARRLGVGSFLMSNAVREMIQSKCHRIRFRYSVYGDRTALTPFFNEIGYETESADAPLGRKTLWELNEAMEKKGIAKVSGNASCLYEIEKTERLRLREELARISGQHMDVYDKNLPGTYVVTAGDKLRAAVFVSEEISGHLSLDYLYGCGSPKDIASVMKTAVMRLLTHYDRDTICEMLLTTDAGKKLYEGVFGEATAVYRMASCEQPFGVL